MFLCSAGDLLMLLNVTSDEKILPTPYGELRPPLGKHRLKVYFSLACSTMGTVLCDVVVVPLKFNSWSSS